MKPSLIDTDILSFFLKENRKTIERFSLYVKNFDKINISILTYYEIMSGLTYRDAQKRMKAFSEFVSSNTVLPISKQTVSISAQIYADLRKHGNIVDDIDILIAGTAMANGLTLVTHNVKHFEKISGLAIEDWSVE